MSRTTEQRVLRAAKKWRKRHDMTVDAYVRNDANLAFDLMSDGVLMYAVDAHVESEKRFGRSRRKRR